MNEPDLSSLTYKELQALAVRFRVPGNIKKHQLVKVLEAVQSGDATEVGRLLAELHQTRKKRSKKVKRDNKMNVASTPVHSPNYAMSEDYYYNPQQHPPYDWVGAEEEISSREDEVMRYSSYDDYQLFLRRRNKREYRPYGSLENSLVQGPSVVDLRMGAGSSVVSHAGVNRARATVVTNPRGYDQALPNLGDYQVGEDDNGNNQVSIILKKMLQAPVGANLSQISSPVPTERQMSSLEQRQYDNSETESAKSDCGDDDSWEYDNPGYNNCGYSNTNNDTKLAPSVNQSQLQDKTVQNISQQPTNFLCHVNDLYRSNTAVSDVQANCQKWIATNSFANRDANCGENSDISRSYNPGYYVNSSGNNGRNNKARNVYQNYQNNVANDNVNYETNPWSFHGQSSTEANAYYQISAETSNASVMPNDAYYAQQMAKRMSDVTEKFFAQGSNNNLENNMSRINGHQAAAVGSPGSQFPSNHYNRVTGALFNSTESHGAPYNVASYPSWSIENVQSLAALPNSEHQQYQYQQQQQQQMLQLPQYHQQYHQEVQFQQEQQEAIQEMNDRKYSEQEMGERKYSEQQMGSQPISNGALTAYWPHWPMNSTVTSGGQLEPTLNLHNSKFVDSARLNQSYCVYCYMAPVVTQRVEFSNISCSQDKHFKAECRQHSFRSTPLVYSDASTGMTMSNISEQTATEACPRESFNSGPSTSSMDVDSENMASVESSESSINDVWIHDYTRYTPSAEYPQQSDCLIIDENENDLFSL